VCESVVGEDSPEFLQKRRKPYLEKAWKLLQRVLNSTMCIELLNCVLNFRGEDMIFHYMTAELVCKLAGMAKLLALNICEGLHRCERWNATDVCWIC